MSTGEDLEPSVLEAARCTGAAGVRLAILFGSRAHGDTARADSDWDIGVIGMPEPREPLREALAAALGGEIDLVDLDRASPTLCDHALRRGRVLFDRDGSELARFASLTIRRHDDHAKVRRAQEESLLRFAELHRR